MGGAGEYGDGYYAAQTDVTVLSGTWRYVFAGGYVSSVSGDAKLKASNCTATRIGGSHNGKLDGNVYMQLDHVTVTDGAIYGGNQQKNNVAGNVTMVLGEGIGAAKVYAGSNEDGNVGGTVTIIADGVDLTKTTIHGKANNTTGTVGALALELRQGQLADVADTFITRDGVTVALGCQQTKTANIPYDIALELNGYDLTCTGNGALVCSDSKTDDYDVADGVYGTVTTSQKVTAAPGYLAVTQNGKTTVHKYEMDLTELVVNTQKLGITYKANFRGDEIVKASVSEFGIALRAYYSPNATTILLDTEYKTHKALRGSAWQTGSGNTVKSVYVSGILGTQAEGVTTRDNQQRAQVPIYGTGYIRLTDGTMLISSPQSFSLKTAMQ